MPDTLDTLDTADRTASAQAQAPPAAGGAEGEVVDAGTLRRLLQSGATWLERNAAAVNALNVFPVPDGDTGTNMLLTMRAAVDAVKDAATASGAGQVMRAAARGAVMGARGNSGVILSQIISGMARALETRDTCDGPALAAALEQGARTAYRAVTRPVEGTILTVARAAGDGAKAVVERSGASAPSCLRVLERALHAAREAVQRTPEQLAILKQAGVVDAGGEGYRMILEGMALALRGDPLPDAPSPSQTAAPAAGAAGRPTVDLDAIPAEEWGYCTQFVIRGQALDLDQIRDGLQALAASALVVGDESLVRVHGHTDDPGRLLSYATRIGRLERISIEDMDAQHDEWLRSQVAPATLTALATTGDSAPTAGGGLPGDGEDAPATGLATVVVAPGAGLADVFRSLGAGQVVPGGQTMNPSAHELLAAAKRTGAPEALVLPNNGNVIMSAEQAAHLAAGSGQTLVVVPTRTVPQGIAAQLAFNPESDAAANAAAMAEAAAGVRTVEVTRATRSVTLGDISVQAGDALALLDDEVVAAAPDALEAATQALDRGGAATAALIAVYWGDAVDEAAAQGLGEALRRRYPRAEVELVFGGQPHYDYLISVE